MASKAAWLFAALSPLGVVSQLSEMDVAFENGLDILNDGPRGGLNRIASTPYDIYKWPWGTIPEKCYRGALQDDLCSPYNMEVYDVWFPDCHAPWKLCRCKNSPMTAENMADRMAQIPVAARQWIRFWSSYNGTLSAGNGGNDITIFGDASNITSIFFHEVAHSLDSWAMGPEYEGSAFSAYNENYAQVYVMIAYNTQVRSIYNYDVECMFNQIEVGQELLEHLVDYYPWEECTRRWSEKDSPCVCMGWKARKLGKCRGVPDPEIGLPTPPGATPTPTPQPYYDDKDGVKYAKGIPIGAPVDEIAKGEGIVVKANRADDPAKQRVLEEKDMQRWKETLQKAGIGTY